ncbi:MAG: efflux RND transporter periplasmic adaptor subunit [Flavobacteriales bacterium]
MNQVKSVFLFLSSVVLFSCGGSEVLTVQTDTPAEAIPVKIASLQSGAIHTPIVVSGWFTTNEETTLSFKTGGVLSSILVKEGDVVSQGQLLATLDLTEIKALVELTDIALKKAERDLNRVEKLYADSVATLEQWQNARTARDMALEQLNQVRFNERFSEVRAPLSGVILGKLAGVGQVVSPGTPVLRMNGGSAGDWVLRVSVSDKEWSLISEGDQAVVTSDAFLGREFPATVSSKGFGVDPMSGTLSVELKFSSSRDLPLASGLFGKAVVTPTHAFQVWRVPYSALLDGNGKHAFIFCTNDGSRAVKVPVRIASLGKEEVYIDQGLEGYEHMIISGSAYLKDQSLIQIVR